MKKIQLNIKKGVQIALVMLLAGFTFSSCLDLTENPGKSRLAPGSYSNQAELELGVTGPLSYVGQLSCHDYFSGSRLEW